MTNEKNDGRFYVRSLRTGRLYVVEAIGQPRTGFGDSLAEHCRGSIRERDSAISEPACRNIGYARNPTDYIDALERG